MRFIKHHWFGILLSILLLAYLSLFILVMVSPREDLERRGFLKCTDDFVIKAKRCQNAKRCLIGALLGNNLCYAEVVKDGMEAWVEGSQETPWENYLFDPKLSPKDEGLQEFYEANPDLLYDMEELKRLNEELENGQEQPAALEPEGSLPRD